MNKSIKRIIIATGGTGGHVFPAYSLALHIKQRKFDVEIVSDKRGMKYLQKYDEIKKTQISSSTVVKKNVFKFFLSISTIFYSILRSIVFLLKNKPNLVFGMGGYSSFPVCIASKIIGVPYIIYENNLYIGKANKYLLPYTQKIFVSNEFLEGISNKYKKKISVIGNIIRKEILNYEKKNKYSLEDKELKILVLGGSQAAKIFAEILPIIFKECYEANIPLKIYQQCMFEQNQKLKSFYEASKINFEIFNFSDNILEYFSKVDLVITRSGSSILAELINIKIPFISVPLPTSADNHQLKNATFYANNQYSFLIEEKDLITKLYKLMKKISNDKSILKDMANKQKQFSDKSVYKKIDNQIDNFFNETN